MKAFEFWYNTPSRTLGWDFTLIPTITISRSPRVGMCGVRWTLMAHWLLWDAGITFTPEGSRE